jgi:hypothetical protein
MQNSPASDPLFGKSKKKEVIMMPSHRITVGNEVEIISKLSSSSVNNEQNHTTMNSASFSKRKRRTGGVVSAVTDTSIKKQNKICIY